MADSANIEANKKRMANQSPLDRQQRSIDKWTEILKRHISKVWTETEYGNPAAQYVLGLEEHSIPLLEASAKYGIAQAQLRLGIIAHSDNNFPRAFNFFSQAATQGLAEARYELGSMYYFGEGVAKDTVEAVRLFRLAAEQGIAIALLQLGLMYYNGKGVDRDYAEAARLFHLAANHGDAVAQLNLGVLYWHGLGVDQNYAEAARLFRQAAEQGDDNAIDTLQKLGLNITPSASAASASAAAAPAASAAPSSAASASAVPASIMGGKRKRSKVNTKRKRRTSSHRRVRKGSYRTKKSTK